MRTNTIFRFSEKIDLLRQAGLIDHWISSEQDKVAFIANIGGRSVACRGCVSETHANYFQAVIQRISRA